MIRRTIGKCIEWVVKKEIQEVDGLLQMAIGLQSGADAGIHSMKVIFDDEQTDAAMLVDASNAFNSLNGNAALRKTKLLRPQFSTILINTYRLPVRMIFGSKDIVSNEGTTQGDNLVMSFFALGTATLFNYLLISSPNVKIVCLAGDITGAGTWPTIISEGSKFGYYVNKDKSWLIVKNKNFLNEAQQVFSNSDIKFMTKGKRHLGAATGSSDFRYMQQRK